MTTPRIHQRPRTAPVPAPGHPARPRPRPVQQPVRPVVPAAPPWHHRLLPAAVRGLMADLGWWNNPVPVPPSVHLEQVLAVLRRYGWCQSLDVTPTGRMCLRGAQNLLEKTGHVTPAGRERAVHYLQHTLAQAGITMQFWTWNDLPDQEFSAVEVLLTEAARAARQNGE